jgi:hypothetical protein
VTRRNSRRVFRRFGRSEPSVGTLMGDDRTVGGIVVPVTRRVYAAHAAHRKIPDLLLVSIDLRDISFDRN